jgi:hypothetical protein
MTDVPEPTDPDVNIDIDAEEAEIAANVLVIDVDPIPGLGEAPPNEPDESYLPEPPWLR